VAEAGQALGMPWFPQDKFMQPERSPDFDCGAHCLLGCRCGAKWNAAEFVDQGVASGLRVVTGARVDRVLIADGRAAGVEGRRRGRRFRIEGGTVIVAAGGIGSATLLRASGIDGAGRGIAMDTTAMVYGDSGGPGMGGEAPMTWSCADDDLGALYSTLIDPWLMYPIIMLRKGPTYPLTWHRWGRTFGVMIKLKDEISGGVDDRGTVSKGLTARDRERLATAEEAARRVLREAGCRPDSLFTTPLRGTHPSATARIGDVVDSDLATAVPGLHVCDASVFPEALARPTVLTIIALAERLGRHLLRA
jgi:choline dehydrogenase-like flavoprotein